MSRDFKMYTGFYIFYVLPLNLSLVVQLLIIMYAPDYVSVIGPFQLWIGQLLILIPPILLLCYTKIFHHLIKRIKFLQEIEEWCKANKLST